MAYKITISCDEDTHQEFKRMSIDSVSSRLNSFMAEEVKGREKAFLSLVERVNQLEAIVNESTVSKDEGAGF